MGLVFSALSVLSAIISPNSRLIAPKPANTEDDPEAAAAA